MRDERTGTASSARGTRRPPSAELLNLLRQKRTALAHEAAQHRQILDALPRDKKYRKAEPRRKAAMRASQEILAQAAEAQLERTDRRIAIMEAQRSEMGALRRRSLPPRTYPEPPIVRRGKEDGTTTTGKQGPSPEHSPERQPQLLSTLQQQRHRLARDARHFEALAEELQQGRHMQYRTMSSADRATFRAIRERRAAEAQAKLKQIDRHIADVAPHLEPATPLGRLKEPAKLDPVETSRDPMSVKMALKNIQMIQFRGGMEWPAPTKTGSGMPPPPPPPPPLPLKRKLPPVEERQPEQKTAHGQSVWAKDGLPELL